MHLFVCKARQSRVFPMTREQSVTNLPSHSRTAFSGHFWMAVETTTDVWKGSFRIFVADPMRASSVYLCKEVTRGLLMPMETHRITLPINLTIYWVNSYKTPRWTNSSAFFCWPLWQSHRPLRRRLFRQQRACDPPPPANHPNCPWQWNEPTLWCVLVVSECNWFRASKPMRRCHQIQNFPCLVETAYRYRNSYYSRPLFDDDGLVYLVTWCVVV